MQTNTLFFTSRSVLPRMRNLSDKSCGENQDTHFMFGNVYSKTAPFIDNVGQYCRAEKATDDNMEHTHCLLDS
jgi:hypothetical protein